MTSKYQEALDNIKEFKFRSYDDFDYHTLLDFDFDYDFSILQELIDKYERELELLSILKPHFYFGTSGQECEPIIEFKGIQIPWFREKDPTYSNSEYCKVKEWLLNDK